jgi:UDP-N-acetylmuramoyl-L-alanyl-D-glutamate--2,6-diaminopimelate ligase
MSEANWTLVSLTDGIIYLGRNASATKIDGLSLDSRQVQPGDLFFACAGSVVHGKTYIDEAIERGAVAVLWESSIPKQGERQGVPLFGISELKQKIGLIAERFYGRPSQQLQIVGVTGTNGKTSVSQFVAQALSQDGPCGVIGTLGYGLAGQLQAGEHTTPDALALYAHLAAFRTAGASRAVMEVSSHALDQSRAAGVSFDVAVFTNLSHEHLDYHGNMHAYGQAKRRLFETEGLKYAVINLDDDYGRSLLVSMPGAVGTVSYGFEAGVLTPSLLGSDLQLEHDGLRMRINSDWGCGELRVPLLGGFNAANLLAALGALLAMGVSFDDALQRLAGVQPVPGRMQGFGGTDDQPLVVVDYAHTPDALEQVLGALRAHSGKKLWCVFGCGGDRDRAKRPMMAAVAGRLADRVIVTDDNPRNEDPQVIIADILAGFADEENSEVIGDRAQAIARAVSEAAPGDIVLVAGKGHEDSQWVGDERRSFSDVQQVQQALAARGGGA